MAEFIERPGRCSAVQWDGTVKGADRVYDWLVENSYYPNAFTVQTHYYRNPDHNGNLLPGVKSAVPAFNNDVRLEFELHHKAHQMHPNDWFCFDRVNGFRILHDAEFVYKYDVPMEVPHG